MRKGKDMRFSFNMLLELASSTWEVFAVQSSNDTARFSSIRLLEWSDEVGFDEDTLYVGASAALLEQPSNHVPRTLCICTQSFEDASTYLANLDEGVSWVLVSAPSVVALFNRLLDYFSVLEAWEDEMDRILQGNGDLQKLLDASEPVLNMPVVACGPMFDSCYCTSRLSSDVSIFFEISQNGQLSSDGISELENLGMFSASGGDKNVRVFPPNQVFPTWHMSRLFLKNKERVFFAIALCADGKPSLGLIELFDLLAKKLYELYRIKRSAEEIDFGHQGMVLNKLLSDDEFTKAKAERLFQGIHRETGGLWRLAIIKFENSDTTLKSYQANLLRKGDYDALTCIYEGNIVMLSKSPEIHERRPGRLVNYAKKHGATIGLSSLIDDVADTQVAYKQAYFAIRMGAKISTEQILKTHLGIDKNYPDNCFAFDDYLFHELLVHYPLGTRGMNPGRRPTFDLVAHDQQYGTQKTRFLYTYLQCNCSVCDTAMKLGIHRNSVGYQVKSIETLLGIDVHDIGFICHTQIAFASIEVFGL